MARLARVIAPGIPHHITQRGNRRQQTFFKDQDYQTYLELMSEWCNRYQVEIWAYCLMPNHVHLIVVPETRDSLKLAIGEAHRRYTRHVNFREGWRGHLWQGRFSSFILDEPYLLACTKYIELNPVRAGLVRKPEEWHWSSAGPHLNGKDDKLVIVAPLLDLVQSSWKRFLAIDAREPQIELFRKHERTGRPLGEEGFIDHLEQVLGRKLKPQKPGPKTRD